MVRAFPQNAFRTDERTIVAIAPERTALTVRPVAGHIGADVSGVDLAAAIDAGTVEELTAALHRHKVLFFRGQDLDHAAHIRFGRLFGELTYAHPHDDTPPKGHPEIFTIDPSGTSSATAVTTTTSAAASTATWPVGTPTSRPR
jgi:alpha-ketoglutarate-dependent taurine dioxygenase